MSKHTPGPWVIFQLDGELTVMPAGRPGDIAIIEYEPDERDEASANADLIAAAPEILAALRTCRCPAGGWTGIKDGTEPTIENCMREADCGCVYGDLIRKAEGNANLPEK